MNKRMLGYGVILGVETLAMAFVTSFAGYATIATFKKAFKKEDK